MKKFVLVKSYYGLGGNLSALSCGALLAKRLGRGLVIDWRGGNYGSAENYYSDLFTPLENQYELGTIHPESVIFPEYWKDYWMQPPLYVKGVPLTLASSDLLEQENFDSLNEPDVIVVTRDGKYFHRPEYQAEMRNIFSEIKPRSDIEAEIEVFRRANLSPPTIGVHFRHGNGEATVVPPPINWFFTAVEKLLARTGNPHTKIFVASDCKAVVDVFIERYPDRVVSLPKHYPQPGSGGMHYRQGNSEKLDSAKEALMDIRLLASCDYFIGSKSFFSACANLWSRGFDRSNSIWYIPTERSFKPNPDLLEVSKQLKLVELFGEDFPLDNLYISKTQPFNLYFQSQLIADCDSMRDVSGISRIKAAIKEIRLY